MKKLLIALPIIALFIACNNEAKVIEEPINEEVQLEENEKTAVLSEELLSMFEFTMINQPLPLNVIKSIDKFDGNNDLQLEEIISAEDILGSYKKNLALGIYGSQLLYVIEKNHFSQIPSLLKVVNTLSDNIGFPEIIDAKKMAFYEANKENKDSLSLMAINTFEELSAELKNNGQIEQATLILTAGKIESIRLGVLSLEKASDKDALITELKKESNSISELLLILNEFKADENINNFIIKTNEIQTELNKETIDSKYFESLTF